MWKKSVFTLSSWPKHENHQEGHEALSTWEVAQSLTAIESFQRFKCKVLQDFHQMENSE